MRMYLWWWKRVLIEVILGEMWLLVPMCKVLEKHIVAGGAFPVLNKRYWDDSQAG
jgi:hypothetical protein